MNLYKKITDGIARIAELVCIVMIAGLVVVIVAELFNRNFLNKSFRATIEICGIFFLWMAFSGLIPLYRDGGLMRLDFLLARAKGGVYELLYLINKLFSLMLGVVMIIAFFAQYPYVSTRFYATIPTLPYTIQYIPMAIAGGYFVLKTVEQLIQWVMERGKGATTNTNSKEV